MRFHHESHRPLTLLSRFERTGKRSEIFLATKVGFVVGGTADKSVAIDGSPEHVRKALLESLKRLRTDYIDLWYLHRYETVHSYHP